MTCPRRGVRHLALAPRADVGVWESDGSMFWQEAWIQLIGKGVAAIGFE